MTGIAGFSIRFGAVLACLALASPPARAADEARTGVQIYHPGVLPLPPKGSRAEALYRRSPTNRISGLAWARSAEVSLRRGPNGLAFFADIRGKFAEGARTLSIHNDRVTVAASGDFTASFPISGELQIFNVYAVDFRGKAETETIILEVPDWNNMIQRMTQAPAKPGSIMVSVGPVQYHYSESGVPTFNELAITGKVSFVRDVGPPGRWNLGLNAFFTLAPLKSTHPDGAKIQFYGINARAGYHTRILPGTWRLTLLGGIYFITTSTSTNSFGFQNLMGPQFYPLISRSFSKGRAFSLYAKYSPVGSGLSLNFKSRELASGISWTQTFGSTPTIVALDYAKFTGTIEGISLSSTAISLSFGVGF